MQTKAGWLYVLEIAPDDRIKVGRTSKLGNRLAAHVAAARFGGGSVRRVFCVEVVEPETAEIELIAAVRHQPGAAVVQGKEVFDGVTFERAVRIASDVAQVRALPSEEESLPTSLIADCSTALGDADRVALRELRDRLADLWPDRYRAMDTTVLGKTLRAHWVPIVALWIDGRSHKGIRRCDLDRRVPGASLTGLDADSVDRPA